MIREADVDGDGQVSLQLGACFLDGQVADPFVIVKQINYEEFVKMMMSH